MPYRQIKVFGVEEHESAEQDVWRMSTKLFALPQVLLFHAGDNVFY